MHEKRTKNMKRMLRPFLRPQAARHVHFPFCCCWRGLLCLCVYSCAMGERARTSPFWLADARVGADAVGLPGRQRRQRRRRRRKLGVEERTQRSARHFAKSECLANRQAPAEEARLGCLVASPLAAHTSVAFSFVCAAHKYYTRARARTRPKPPRRHVRLPSRAAQTAPRVRRTARRK